MSIADAGKALRAGEITARQLTEDSLNQVAALDHSVNAFVLVSVDRALKDAEKADADFANGIDRGPMQGIPYALKDIYATAGIRTTCHSNLFRDYVPSTDSAVAERLSDGGGVLVGKVATYEFSIGGPSFDLPFPPARNPWNLDHITGGSSSGSAAAVAAGMVRMAMGSDTGGSIRGPAGYCGVVGLKPTYGRVSRRGVFPLAYSFDHCGPLSRSVKDAALALQVIAGYDPLDPASAGVSVPDFSAKLEHELIGLRIAYTRDFYIRHPLCTADATKALDAAAQQLASLGAVVEEVDMPPYEQFSACKNTIVLAEAYAIHENDLNTRPYSYGRKAYQLLVSGAVLTAADLVQAFRLRRELSAFLNQNVLKSFDALLAPNTLGTATRFSDLGPDDEDLGAVLAGPFNVTGNPALALPIGFNDVGLPLSAQIVGRPFEESTVLQIGAAYEATAGVAERHPTLARDVPVELASTSDGKNSESLLGICSSPL
ncbi:amidase (plasmid) [Microvirga sp. VF16]|nr:amidase [Microvirga sp. VF16]